MFKFKYFYPSGTPKNEQIHNTHVPGFGSTIRHWLSMGMATGGPVAAPRRLVATRLSLRFRVGSAWQWHREAYLWACHQHGPRGGGVWADLDLDADFGRFWFV